MRMLIGSITISYLNLTQLRFLFIEQIC